MAETREPDTRVRFPWLRLSPATVPGRLATATVAAALLLAALALPVTRWLLWRWESNPVLRGRLLAEDSGCFNCHFGFSRAEIPNPGSRWGSVPRFGAGNAMMYVESRAEIEEFIRFGATRAWLDDAKAAARLASQHLRMPPYGDRLDDREIADLVSFVAAVERLPSANDPDDEGRTLARDHGCLACHGIDGSGGLPNLGSLGGFIPGFRGRNFEDMVRDRTEFREWVLDGTNSRLESNPVIRYFWKRQTIAMPAYRDRLDSEQVDSLWQWVSSLDESRERKPSGA